MTMMFVAILGLICAVVACVSLVFFGIYLSNRIAILSNVAKQRMYEKERRKRLNEKFARLMSYYGE